MKILYVSDSATVSTGYGRVSKELCTAFTEAGHSVTQVGWGFNGGQHDFPFTIIPCDTQKDRFGEDIISNFIREQKPDILFTLGDPWMTEFVPSLEERNAVTWVSYFPIDGYPIPPAWHSWIKNCDVPVTFSRFAQDLVLKEVEKKTALIYHGVDVGTFKPLDKNEIKSEAGADNLFIVGTVARNQPRKNLPALVKAFSIFAKNKPDVALYMHSQVVDVGWNLEELVRTYEITDKSFTTDNFSALKGVPDDELARIYNLFDLFVLPTMAEGFGLPIVEAQACGIPVLVTDFSACSELVIDKQELIKVKDTLVMGRNINQAIADVDDIVRKLNYFYNDWKNGGKKLGELSKKGRKNAEGFNWNIINNEFNKLLAQIEPLALKRDKRILPTFYRV